MWLKQLLVLRHKRDSWGWNGMDMGTLQSNAWVGRLALSAWKFGSTKSSEIWNIHEGVCCFGSVKTQSLHRRSIWAAKAPRPTMMALDAVNCVDCWGIKQMVNRIFIATAAQQWQACPSFGDFFLLLMAFLKVVLWRVIMLHSFSQEDGMRFWPNCSPD